MTQHIAIYWFRQDLRLADNPALWHASQHDNVLPIYIMNNTHQDAYNVGEASRWWLHHSLIALNKALNNRLSVYHGNAESIINGIIERFNVEAIYWNRCYEPWRITRDSIIKQHVKAQHIDVCTFNGSLLWEPWTIKKNDGTPYKVFTPFYRRGCLNAEAPRVPLPQASIKNYVTDSKQIGIDALNLLPKHEWSKKLEPHWHIGEIGAKKRFALFADNGIESYKDGRNIPSKSCVSRLSPHLHFGEMSPNQLWYAIRSIDDTHHIDNFCSQLGWREFSYSQLYYNPTLPYKNLQGRFDAFPWVTNNHYLHAWQQGQTGIPMVDAGMRELWQTGYMHNRVRMIVGSFLVKNLRLHWHYGARWFWNTLIDADLANNSASWQWIAGCGADAAPYFRIFNPVTQGQKFDEDGMYIRQYIPEIAALPNKYLFNPWDAPNIILDEAAITLGVTYPTPIIDIKQSRHDALEAFKSLKSVMHT